MRAALPLLLLLLLAAAGSGLAEELPAPRRGAESPVLPAPPAPGAPGDPPPGEPRWSGLTAMEWVIAIGGILAVGLIAYWAVMRAAARTLRLP